MDNLLSNPPKIRKKTQAKEDREEVFSLERTTSSFLGKKKAWKYLAKNRHGEKTEGFARSKRGALIKMKLWSVRREARARKERKKDIKSLPLDDFLHLTGDSFSFFDYEEETLRGQKVTPGLLLFSAASKRAFFKKTPLWSAGLVEISEGEKSRVEVLAKDEKSRRRAEKKALQKIRKTVERKELDDLQASVKKG